LQLQRLFIASVWEGGEMKIRSLMIPDPISISPEASIREALELMKKNSIRHLPVVAADKHLVGFVTLADLKQGLIPSMLADVSLTDLMVSDPITAHPDDDVELAARLIHLHNIGGIPVVEDGRLVGILTESDILRTFIEMMGILSSGERIDIAAGAQAGVLNKALSIIDANGAEVINVSMSIEEKHQRIYHVRLNPCDTAPIQAALAGAGFEVL
jgi:acetoin utilization protein AcuB